MRTKSIASPFRLESIFVNLAPIRRNTLLCLSINAFEGAETPNKPIWILSTAILLQMLGDYNTDIHLSSWVFLPLLE
jgi:hypothetical protein